MYTDQKRTLLKKLLDLQEIKHDHLEDIQNYQQKYNLTLYEVLIKAGYVEQEKLTRMLAQILELKYLAAEQLEFEEKYLQMLPFEFVDNYKICCLNFSDNTYHLAIAEPENLKVLYEIRSGLSDKGYDSDLYCFSIETFENIINFLQYEKK